MTVALTSFNVGKTTGFKEGIDVGVMIAQEEALYSRDGYMIKPSRSECREAGYAYGKYFWYQGNLEIYGYGHICNSTEWLKLKNQDADQVKSVYLLGNFKSIADQKFCEQFPNLEIVYISPDCEIEDGVFPESVKIQLYMTSRNCPEMP